MEEKPNYYAILTADVRYDKRLRDKAKLLYSEISALSNKEGYCYASNKYFAELYDVSITTISTLIKELIDYGYIESEIIYKEGTKEILNRYLKIFKGGYLKKFKEGYLKNFKYNNINNNNININNNITTKIDIYTYYEERVGSLSPMQYELFNNLLDKVGEDKVKEAIDKTIANNISKNQLSYIIKVASNLNDTNTKIQTNSKVKSISTPNWVNEEIDSEEMSEEEIEELRKELEIFYK